MPPRPPSCATEAGCPGFPSVCDAGSSCLCWGSPKRVSKPRLPRARLQPIVFRAGGIGESGCHGPKVVWSEERAATLVETTTRNWSPWIVRPSGALLRLGDRACASLGTRPGWLGLLLLCITGLLVRLWVARVSIGSNDILTWQGFAQEVLDHGVPRTYLLDGGFNHPPLMGYLAAASLRVAKVLGLPFAFVFKLTPIVASVLTIYGLGRGYRVPWWTLLLLVVSPIDILISSYHGNTDTLCVAFSVAALLAANGERPILSGLALGAAINVKLIPVIAIVPLLASLPSWKARLRFSFSLGVSALPFVPILLSVFHAFVQNAILYNSCRAYWGFGMLAYGSDASFPRTSEVLWHFTELGKYPILAGSAAYAMLPLVGRRIERAQYCAFAFTTFLVFASGFGPQYLVYPAPFLIVVRPRLGSVYAFVSGLFALLLYHWYWTHTYPLFSEFRTRWPDTIALMVGFGSWCMLAYYWLASVGEQAAALREHLLRQYFKAKAEMLALRKEESRSS
jgi:hypothetical protein